MWTDERVAFLRKRWAEGDSASQIAKKLGGVTRNAVIGKTHRLGLAGRPHVYAANANKVKGARIKRLATRDTPPTKALKAERLAADLAIIRALPALGEPLGQATGCRFIPGDPQVDSRVCGRATSVGGVWCADHARLVYVPTRPRTITPESLELARIKREIRQVGRSL